MSGPKNVNDLILERLAEGLDSTSKMTHALLTELKESEADFAVVKTELGILRENVKGLSEIIREGNGASSILTRLALMEQKIASIEKWMENHVDVHQRAKSEVSNVRNEVDEIDRKINALTKDVNDIIEQLAESERKKRQSIDRELELHHDKNKNEEKLRAERNSAIIKFTIALLLAVVGTLGTLLANSCNSLTIAPNSPPSITAPTNSSR
jgi:hypothetical protein